MSPSCSPRCWSLLRERPPTWEIVPAASSSATYTVG